MRALVAQLFVLWGSARTSSGVAGWFMPSSPRYGCYGVFSCTRKIAVPGGSGAAFFIHRRVESVLVGTVVVPLVVPAAGGRLSSRFGWHCHGMGCRDTPWHCRPRTVVA